ncbi:MAG: cytidine deaminase [Bacteroidales bacterium]|jgi:cytidine deaminase|nr:cytidine deaminase [Bacteroidales bacterium]
MTERQITTKIHFCAVEELSDTEKMLLNAAKEAAVTAYAPYSHFQVGAALLLDNGEVVKGSNQENAAYPSGLCAERVAMFYANATWPNATITHLVVAARNGKAFINIPIAPCGACRQSLLEAERRQGAPIRVLLYGTNETVCIESVKTLLPLSFDESFLKE